RLHKCRQRRGLPGDEGLLPRSRAAAGGKATRKRSADAADRFARIGSPKRPAYGHGRRSQCALAYSREMDVRTSQAITVEQLGGDETAWNELLARSVNGTLFHDLHFLRYHPADRFAFHHLVFKRDGRPVALLPGGLSGTAGPPTFCSPLGASVGGFAVAGLTAELAMGLVDVLQAYARMPDLAGVQITPLSAS